MKASKEIFDKIMQYQSLKLELNRLCSEIKNSLEKEYLEKTGFTLGVGTFEPFISDSASGEKEDETGTYCEERPVGHARSSKYWYVGKEFIPVEDSDKFIGYEYER